MLSRIIIDGMAFEATEAIIEFNLVGTQADVDFIADCAGKNDLPFTTEDGTMGTIIILESKSAPSLQWPGKSNIKIKAGLRLKG